MNNITSAILCDYALNFTPISPTAVQTDFSVEQKKPSDGLSVRERRELNRKKWISTPLDFDFTENDTAALCGMKRLGISHIKDEKPCQDNFLILCDDELGVELIVAADGHGDKKHDLSQIGSSLACCALKGTVIRTVKEKNILSDSYFKSVSFKEDIVNFWTELVIEYHENNFSDSEETLSQILTRYGTTLLFAFCYHEKIYAGRLGDGGIILSAKDNSYTLFADDDKLGTSTCSMCMDNSHMLMNVKVYNANELDSVMLMTDGMFDIFTDEKYLFSNMKEFLSGIQKNEDERNDYFGELYNRYVEYITDDTTVCLLSKKTAAQTDIDSYFETIGICPVSVVYREHSIKARYINDGVSYTAIFSKAFSKEQTVCEELIGFIAPIDTVTVGDYVCNIYPDSGADEYKNIYALLDEMIKKRRTKIADNKIISITNCLLPFISSNEPELLINSDELLLELIEYSEADGAVRIFAFSEKEKGIKSYQSVMAQLLIFLTIGSITEKADITNVNLTAALPLPYRSDIVNDNMLRTDRRLLKKLLLASSGASLPDDEDVYITQRCKACGNIIWTYKNISLCPHCNTQLLPMAVLSADSDNIFGYICVGTSIEITENPGCNDTAITAHVLKNPVSGQLGIKNSSTIPWQFPNESVTIQPGQIKGITNDTVLKINDWNFNISLLK